MSGLERVLQRGEAALGRPYLAASPALLDEFESAVGRRLPSTWREFVEATGGTDPYGDELSTGFAFGDIRPFDTHSQRLVAGAASVSGVPFRSPVPIVVGDFYGQEILLIGSGDDPPVVAAGRGNPSTSGLDVPHLLAQRSSRWIERLVPPAATVRVSEAFGERPVFQVADGARVLLDPLEVLASLVDAVDCSVPGNPGVDQSISASRIESPPRSGEFRHRVVKGWVRDLPVLSAPGSNGAGASMVGVSLPHANRAFSALLHVVVTSVTTETPIEDHIGFFGTSSGLVAPDTALDVATSLLADRTFDDALDALVGRCEDTAVRYEAGGASP